MKKIFLTGLASLVFAALGQAQPTTPACSTITVLSSLVGSSCLLGDAFVLKQVGFSSSSSGGELTASQVNFSSSYVAGVISIGLSGPFQTSLGQTHTYQIGFLIDPPPEVIIGFDSDVDWGSTTNSLTTQAGSGSIGGSLCSGAGFTDTPPSAAFCPGVFQGFISNPANPSASLTFPATNIVHVIMNLQLTDGGQLNSIFTQTQSTLTTPVPEPAAGGLAGLLGVAMFAIRRRRGLR